MKQESLPVERGFVQADEQVGVVREEFPVAAKILTQAAPGIVPTDGASKRPARDETAEASPW